MSPEARGYAEGMCTNPNTRHLMGNGWRERIHPKTLSAIQEHVNGFMKAKDKLGNTVGEAILGPYAGFTMYNLKDPDDQRAIREYAGFSLYESQTGGKHDFNSEVWKHPHSYPQGWGSVGGNGNGAPIHPLHELATSPKFKTPLAFTVRDSEGLLVHW